MDPFTQRMLEKAEQRSRALGISSAPASKFPLGECSQTDATSAVGGGSGACATMAVASEQRHQQLQPSSGNNVNRLQVIETTAAMETSESSSGSPKKVLRQFSAVDKENMDLGIEINIMTNKDVEVEVQVEEKDMTDSEANNERGQIQQQPNEAMSHPVDAANHPVAKIRDTSRNRLQRLGALYSNTDDLSSPIHRTEGKFHAGGADDAGLDKSPKKPKQRYGRLAALADSINQWEDDTSHHVVSTVPPPKPDLPSRGRLGMEARKKAPAPQPPTSQTRNPLPSTTEVSDKDNADTGGSGKTKQLKWDPKVIHSLEAQGFQRRESSTIKLAYDYKREQEESDEVAKDTTEESSKQKKCPVGNASNTFTAAAGAVDPVRDKESAPGEKRVANVKPGLVSGRTAIFEDKANAAQQSQQRPQKDPAELSLKERMKLFERNKGEALLPKAPLGMAPPISKILQDAAAKKNDSAKASSKFVTSFNTGASAAPIKPNADNKLRDKVAALVSANSETKIKDEILKQRQEDMQLLTNRFNKQKEIFGREQVQGQQISAQQQEKESELKALAQQSQVKATAATLISSSCPSSQVTPPLPPPPPPMPPMPPMPPAETPTSSIKRRSRDTNDDETKRARRTHVNGQRLYPALSDLESNESEFSDDNCCSTVTASAHSTADEFRTTRASSGARGVGVIDTAAASGAHNDVVENEDNESYMDSEADDSSVGICNDSLGREVMHTVERNDRQTSKSKEVRYADKNEYFGGAGESSLNSSEASVGVDDYLDEALDRDDNTESLDEFEDHNDSKGHKGTKASNSFSFRKVSENKNTICQTISEEDFQTPNASGDSNNSPVSMQPVKSELSVNKENDNMVTLVHTVSFYRRQQGTNSASSTPVRKITREYQVLRSELDKQKKLEFGSPEHEDFTNDGQTEEGNESQSESELDDENAIQNKIKTLLDEVCKQQQIIAQTSQALNLCASTIEFSGSTESVEGERHLLVATHRRQACLDEVQRLRVEKTLRCPGAGQERGNLTVKDITLPLRQDYIRKLAADTISGHHLVCLLKYNERVLATKSVPTLPGLLAVKFPDVLQLNNVFADFRVTLEIYGMTAQREILPHEIKYHINVNKKSGLKTPKKKAGDNRLVMPPVQSPAGPHVVRTPALVQYGFAIFSLREIQRTTWTLTQVLGVSPLEGIVHMKVNCELSVVVEHRGFVTMFEDISGFGAWHRRWCYLNGTILNYWKYPDDENKKAPMGTIDLYTCSSQHVSTAPRDICARLNTILLECQRPAKSTDQESLVVVPNGRTTIIRYLLSADTKEEREEWCAYFNKVLTLLRAWGPPQ